LGSSFDLFSSRCYFEKFTYFLDTLSLLDFFYLFDYFLYYSLSFEVLKIFFFGSISFDTFCFYIYISFLMFFYENLGDLSFGFDLVSFEGETLYFWGYFGLIFFSLSLGNTF